MLGPVDYVVWFASAFFQAAVVVCSIRSRSFTSYLPLNLYMLGSLVLSICRFVIFMRSGYTSSEYVYFYYYSDAVDTVLLYSCIMGLYQHVLTEMGVSKYLRVGSILLLGGTALVSLLLVREHTNQLTTRFVVELSQNLYFVGVVLTCLLWGTVVKLRETRTRLVQLVLALGIYFSASAGAYALRNMAPDLKITMFVPPLAGTFLPLAWSCTFWKIPEEARLATARVATPNR